MALIDKILTPIRHRLFSNVVSPDSGTVLSSAEKSALSLAGCCAGLTLGLGGVALFGWIIDSPVLRGLNNPTLQMKPNACIGFILAGIALFCFIRPSRHRFWLGNLCALVMTALGLATIAEYLFEVDLGIDQLLFAEKSYGSYGPPGRMVAASAINFFAKGFALLIIDWETKKGRRPAQYLSLLTAIAPFLVLVAYGYGTNVVAVLGSLSYLTQMAPHTAIAWLALSLGTLCARPKVGFMRAIFLDSHAAVFLRRVLPIAIIVPPMLAWLLMLGERSELFFPGFGGSLFTLASVCLLTTVIWRSARDLSKNELALKEGQEKLQVANERLQQSEKALKEHVERLARSNADLEEYAYVASHDLKEPLRTITLYSQMIARTHRGKLGEATDANIQFINEATKRMYHLIDDLLEYSRAGRGDAPLKPTDCRVLIEAVIHSLEETIRTNHAEITVGPLPSVLGDSLQLTQLFQNLISNALKYRSQKKNQGRNKGRGKGRFCAVLGE